MFRRRGRARIGREARALLSSSDLRAANSSRRVDRRVRLALVALVSSGLLLACGDDPYQGQPPHVERRHIALEGAHNFRDLGGYPTEDGRSVRWGLLFRSDALAELTDADLEVLHSLGLRLVCDFRSPQEKALAPDRLPAEDPPQVAELEIAIEGFDIGELRERILSGDVEGIDLVEGNRQFVRQFAPQYAAMFERITRPENLPALIHCTGGKDRAGLAAALILRTLRSRRSGTWCWSSGAASGRVAKKAKAAPSR